MRRPALCSLLGLALGACASASPPAPRAALLPAFELERADGQASSLKAALGGSVGVIDLWATWCTACEHERPKIERLDAAYRGRGLRVIGLNVGEPRAVVAPYLAENHISYTVYLDPDFRMADALGDKQLPTILVIDREGRIAHRSSSLDSATLAQLKALLAAAPPN